MTIEELYEVFKKHPVVSTDTRSITEGCIFFALKGENFNGNSFAMEALKKGAAFAVIDEAQYQKGEQTILVENCLAVLQQLANHHRRQLKCLVIAVTGSNGKTTTKELINRVLAKKYRTLSTKGNLNNHIGVPLTILSAPPETEMLVVEMGANHRKEIEILCAIAMPDYGVISNVGKAHLEGFGGFDGVKKGKGELYDFLALHHGYAFVNGDSPHLVDMVKMSNVKQRITYGANGNSDCKGRMMEKSPFLKVEWTYGNRRGVISSRLVGDYNFENILAAVCIGNYFKVESEKISDAVEEYIPDNSRSQVLKKGSNTIILDAYNANPTSMAAALKNFSAMEGKNKIVFLGDMAELGDESYKEHMAIVDLLRQLNFKKVVMVGKHFQNFSVQFPAFYFLSSGAALAWAKQQHITDSTILIKGSRSSKMETVLDGL